MEKMNNSVICNFDHTRDNVLDAIDIREYLPNIDDIFKDILKPYAFSEKPKSAIVTECICAIRKQVFGIECTDDDISESELYLFTLGMYMGKMQYTKHFKK